MLSASILGTVAQLWIYPVKSCAGVRLDAAELTPQGLAHDRAWMVVDAEGEMLTQREWPQMALIHPQLGGDTWMLQAPDQPTLTLPLAAPTEAWRRTTVRVWDDAVPAWDMGETASAWFTRYLQHSAPALAAQRPLPLRLVRFDDAHRRRSSATWSRGHEGLNRFSDGFAVLVLSQASLTELNRRLQAQGQPAVDVRRFRPNLVLDGADWMAHDEDRVGALHIQTDAGTAALLPVKPCPRCPIPDIDPDDASTRAPVTPVLQTYRADARVGGALSFGMNALVVQGVGQVLRVGQTVSADWAFED